MADLKLTGVTALGAAPAAADILYVVDDPGGTPLSRSITAQNLLDTAVVHSGLTFNATDTEDVFQVGGTRYVHEGASGTNECLFIGRSAGSQLGTGDKNLAIGEEAMDAVNGTALTDGRQNIAIGYKALTALTDGTTNVAVGTTAAPALTSGVSNFALGHNSLNSLTTGVSNIAVGANAMSGVTTTSNNIGIGSSAMTNSIGANFNVAVGAGAMSNFDGDRAVCIGAQAGQNWDATNVNYSILIGYRAGRDGTTGLNRSVLIGGFAGDVCASDANVIIGYNAGDTLTSGNNNTFIGRDSAGTVTTGDFVIVIGSQAEPAAAGTDGQISIGNVLFGTGATSTGVPSSPSTNLGGKIGICEVAPGTKLHVTQESTTAAESVLTLEQLDTDETFIDFVGTSNGSGTASISSDANTAASKNGAIRVDINGTLHWIRLYDGHN